MCFFLYYDYSCFIVTAFFFLVFSSVYYVMIDIKALF